MGNAEYMGSLSLRSVQETCSELSSWSPVWHTPPPKPRQRLIPTTDSDTPDLDMVGLDTPGLDTLDLDTLALDMLAMDTMDLDTPDWDTMVSVRPKLSLKLRLIPAMDMDLDMLVLDMLDLDTPDLDTPVLDTPGLDTLVLDTPGLDTPGSDTLAWDMAVDTTLVRGKTPNTPTRSSEWLKSWILRQREKTFTINIKTIKV